jgi:hypothetical protein
MNKDAVRVNQIDLPAVFPSVRLMESLRAAWSIPCLIAAALAYAVFQVDLGASLNNESLDLTAALSPFISTTISKWIFNIEAIFVYGSTRGVAVIAALFVRMLCLGFAAVGIARFAALLVNRHERSGILRTFRFMAGSWKPVIVSTCLTMGIGLIALLLFRILGYFSTWGKRGPDIASASNIVYWSYTCGTLIALYILLTGWLLGLSAIAVDRVDGAESLSRGISYVLSRFRRTSCYLIIIGLIANIAGQVTSWAVTISGSIALRSISETPQASPPLSGGFDWFRTCLVECVQLSTFCCGLALAYLILRQMIDNVDLREISDQK